MAAFDSLLHPVTATEALSLAGVNLDAAQPVYIRHKPNETTIITYRLTIDGHLSWGYTHWCADPARANEIYAKAATLRPRASPFGAGLVRLRNNAVFYGFPNDARLRKLRWYTTARKIKRTLKVLTSADEQISGRQSGVHILRYKPERRVVAKVDLVSNRKTQRLLVRYSTKSNAHHLATSATHLHRNGVATPQPVTQLLNNKVTVDEFIAGAQLRDVVQRDRLTNGHRLAASLARFHHVSPPPHIERRTTHAELRRAASGLRGLIDLHPNLARPAAKTLAILAGTIPAKPGADVLLHGDLHAQNILISPDQLAFVDLERIALGSAAIDLGCFAASALALDIRRPKWSPTAAEYAASMIDKYQQISGPVDPTVLGWCTAIGLIDQALLATRHLEQRSAETSRELLNTAQLTLSDAA